MASPSLGFYIVAEQEGRVVGCLMDIFSALALKYGILGKQAEAQMIQAKAGANLDNTKAGLMPGQVEAEIGLTKAQTNNVNTTTQTIIPESRARVGLMGAQTEEGYANAASTGQDVRPVLRRGFTRASRTAPAAGRRARPPAGHAPAAERPGRTPDR